MNNNQQPVWFNTWVIVIAFIVCWPVGILLLIGRVNSSKQNMFDGSTTTKVCYIIGAILILAGFGSFSNSFLAGLFYVAGGAALIYYGMKNKKKVERYKGYIDLVANQQIYSLDTISSTMNVSYDVVKNEINTLISKGTFRGANINELSRCIEMNLVSEQPAAQGFINGVFEGVGASASNQTVTATCPGCGGTMAAIKGATVECDYCGKIFTAN
ncbi:MAG: hypothetical protein K5877_06805 [Lachnospiraceae bacterium]|nr:hypothetical protein [Lachnospiraceae bacterium]